MVIASYRKEGTNILAKFLLSPRWVQDDHQTLSYAVEKSEPGVDETADDVVCTQGVGDNCNHIERVLVRAFVSSSWYAWVEKFMLPEDHLKGRPESPDKWL